MHRGLPVILCAVFLGLFPANAFGSEPPASVRYAIPPAGRQYCGIDGLYVGLRATGQANDVTLAQIELDTPVGPSGVSLDSLVQTAQKHRVNAIVIRTDLARIARWGNPAVLHVQGQHYVTLLGIEGDRFVVFDNAIGLLDCSQEWFEDRYKWEGVALVLGDPPPELFLRARWHWLALSALGVCGIIYAARQFLGRRTPSAPSLSPASSKEDT